MITPLIFLVLFSAITFAVLGVMFWVSRRSKGTVPSAKAGSAEKTNGEKDTTEDVFKKGHIRELISIDSIQDGIYRANGRCYVACKLEGTNFSVMSDSETDVRESALIEIMTRVDFPVQFISTTAVADITPVAEEMHRRAVSLPDDSKLRQYIELYANQLERMKYNREVLSQKSWFIISCPDIPEEVARMKERLNYLVMAFQEKTGVVLTPVTRFEEIMDIFHEIVLPEEVNRPSQYLHAGVTEPVHFCASEIVNFADEVMKNGSNRTV